MSEVERIFDRDALLKGRAAAVEEIRTLLAEEGWKLRATCHTFTHRSRTEIEREVLGRTSSVAQLAGIGALQLRSFVSGYADIMVAFVEMKTGQKVKP